MIDEIFKNTKVDFNKLIEFGFIKIGDIYNYMVPILNKAFNLYITINKGGEVSTKLIDDLTNDEYVLHLVRTATGEFVGRVRHEYEKVLLNIKEKCFSPCIYKSKQAQEVISYVKNKYGDELEFLWEKSDSAIWRRKDNKKWYGALLKVQKYKLGLQGEDIVEIIDLRIGKSELEKHLDNVKYFKAFHMNKKHWFTICFNDLVDTNNIFEWIDKSYLLAKK